mmetsp:Transcript_9708/g.14634  ORF Transcript_9708/g.14634 Transcript_9708/m.14634 type:complete len:210 (+) Transcript_9708:1160-1789(+)
MRDLVRWDILSLQSGAPRESKPFVWRAALRPLVVAGATRGATTSLDILSPGAGALSICDLTDFLLLDCEDAFLSVRLFFTFESLTFNLSGPSISFIFFRFTVSSRTVSEDAKRRRFLPLLDDLGSSVEGLDGCLCSLCTSSPPIIFSSSVTGPRLDFLRVDLDDFDEEPLMLSETLSFEDGDCIFFVDDSTFFTSFDKDWVFTSVLIWF